MNMLKNCMILALAIACTHTQAMPPSDSGNSGSAGAAAKIAKKKNLKLADKALLVAASIGSETAAEIALNCGADINAQDEDGQTALHKAVIKSYSHPANYALELRDNPKLVQFLMRAGADYTLKTRGGVSVLNALDRTDDIVYRIAPLVLRGVHHCKDLAHDPEKALGKITYTAAYETLRGKQRNENKEKIDQYYALLADSLRAGSDMTCGICFTKGTIIGIAKDFQDKRMQDLLAAFQKEHSEQVVQELKRYHIPKALYPIVFECLYAQPQAGVMTNYCKELLTTPLRTPEIEKDVFEKFKQFRNVDGDIWDARDAQGHNALELAVIQGNMSIVQWMERVPNAHEKLHLYQFARHNGHDQIAQFYLDSIMNDFGRTVMRTADDAHLLKLANLHIPVWTPSNTREALIALAGNNSDRHLEIVIILFAAGADVNAVVPDSSIETHLEFAVADNLHYVIKLLLYLGADHKRFNSITGQTLLEQANNPQTRALLQDPQATLANLTEAEKREFADIKAEREKRFAANKAQASACTATAAAR